MAGFLKSLFKGNGNNTEEEKKKNSNKNFDILKFDGLRAMRIGKPDYALKCFTEALAIEEDFEVYSYQATVHIQLGELDEARKQLDRMIELEPAMVTTYISAANVCYMQENYKDMLMYLEKAIPLEEANPSIYLSLAKAYKGLKDELNAIAHLTKAIVLKGDLMEAYLMRAEVLLTMKQFNEAIHDVEFILRHAEEDTENALLLRGKIHEATAQYEDALKDFSEIIEINPFFEQAYICKGNLFITQNKLDEAIENYNEAIEMNAESAAAYHERGRVKFLKGDKTGATEDMKIAMELDPTSKKDINGEFDNFRDLYANVPL